MARNGYCDCLYNLYLFLINEFTIRDEYSNMEIINSHIDLTLHGMDHLKYIEYVDTEEYIPEISKGKVVKVYSDCSIAIATTFDSDTSISPTVYRFSIWLFDQTADEPILPDRSNKNVAEIMKNILSARILGKMVDLKNLAIDNQGRIEADVFCDDEHINKWAIETCNIIKLNRT